MEGIWSLRKLGMLMVKNPPASAGDPGHAGLIPGLGRSPGGGNGNPLQYSSLKYPMDRGVWWATVHGIAQSCLSMHMLRILGLSAGPTGISLR